MQQHSDLSAFVREAKTKRKLLSIYLTCGYPQLDWTIPLAKAAFESGADLIELGMPFSDPLADGPIIQECSQRALKNRVTLDHLFKTASSLRVKGPILFMGYMNSVLARGFRDFTVTASSSGFSGAIIPDWPIVESHDTRDWNASLLPRIPFVAPTTLASRIREIDALAAPFVYAVSVAGVTGMRELDASVSRYLSDLRSELKTPYLAGFGVSDAESAKRLASVSDGVIVGSAILRGIGSASTIEAAKKFVREFVGTLRQALDSCK